MTGFITVTCPLALDGEAAGSPGFSAAVSPFPAVLETCAPMLSLQQRAQQTQQQNKEQQAKPLHWEKHLVDERAASQRSKRTQSQERKPVGKTLASATMYLNLRFVPVTLTLDCTENGDISLVANKMRSPTPNCAVEWAFRAMTSPGAVVDQSESTISERARLKSEPANRSRASESGRVLKV